MRTPRRRSCAALRFGLRRGRRRGQGARGAPRRLGARRRHAARGPELDRHRERRARRRPELRLRIRGDAATGRSGRHPVAERRLRRRGLRAAARSRHRRALPLRHRQPGGPHRRGLRAGRRKRRSGAPAAPLSGGDPRRRAPGDSASHGARAQASRACREGRTYARGRAQRASAYRRRADRRPARCGALRASCGAAGRRPGRAVRRGVAVPERRPRRRRWRHRARQQLGRFLRARRRCGGGSWSAHGPSCGRDAARRAHAAARLLAQREPDRSDRDAARRRSDARALPRRGARRPGGRCRDSSA